MKTWKKRLLSILIFSFLIAQPLAADSLQEIYQLALTTDPTLGAAEAEYQAALQAKPQARAALLPQINAQAGYDWINTRFKGSADVFKDDDFQRKSYGINLNQVLYNKSNWVRLAQADSQIAQAEAQIQAARQELMLRTAEAYFDALSAKDTLEFAEAEKEAIARQLEQSRERFEVGLIAITDVKESEAQHDLAIAEEIDAQNQLNISGENLRAIIGRLPKNLQPLSDGFELVTPQPANIQKWEESALDNSLALKAAQFTLEIAKKEVERRRAGHHPTLGLKAQYANQDDEGGFNYGESRNVSGGLELSLPLYSGGLTSAQVAEAVQLQKQARNSYEIQRRQSVRDTRASYLNVIAGISRVKALNQALASTQTAAEAAQAGFEVGTRTAVEVLLALRETYRAQRDYSRARYDYILSTFRLKQAAGTLTAKDIAEINQWL
jgi:outer membrane protein